MNLTNILSTMWIISQGTPYIVVHFRSDNHEHKQLSNALQPPKAILTYSDIESLVKLSRETLKSKLWILVLVGKVFSCNYQLIDEATTAIVGCRGGDTMSENALGAIEKSVDYLVLTRWLIPRGIPIQPTSHFMCLAAFDDFTDLPSDYRTCAKRRHLQLGQIYTPHISHLYIADCLSRPIMPSLYQDTRQFLNLSGIHVYHVTLTGPKHDGKLLRRLRLRKIDFIFVSFKISFDRLEEISFTTPTGMASAEFLTKKRTSHALESFGLTRVFDKKTWLCVGSVMFTFYVVLYVMRQRNASMIVLATQLNLTVEVKSRRIGTVMFASGLLLTCFFSSGLLSSLTTYISRQVSTIEDLLDVLDDSETFLCIDRGSSLHVAIETSAPSTGFIRIFVRKKHQGRLMIVDNPEECKRATETSVKIVTALIFYNKVGYKGQLIIGKESLDMITVALPASPGNPLLRRFDVLLGRLREMHVFLKYVQVRDFNVTMKAIQGIAKLEKAKALNVHEIGLPFFILIGASLLGLAIESWMLIVDYGRSRFRNVNIRRPLSIGMCRMFSVSKLNRVLIR